MRDYTGSGQRCPMTNEGGNLYYPAPEVLVVGVTSELRERGVSHVFDSGGD